MHAAVINNFLSFSLSFLLAFLSIYPCSVTVFDDATKLGNMLLAMLSLRLDE